MQRGAERFGVETGYAEVSSVDLSPVIKKITTSSGIVSARSVIVATGASPRELGLPEESSLRGKRRGILRRL